MRAPTSLADPTIAAELRHHGHVLLLARHGRTALNAHGRVRGRLDPPLDEVGRTEAARLGDALARYRPTRVVSSPLLRGLQTAEAVAAPSGVAVEVDSRLADRDYGPAAGLTLVAVRQRWGQIEHVPGVESRQQVLRRALQALDEIHRWLLTAASEVPGGSPAGRPPSPVVVVVAHDAVNRAVLAHLLAPADHGEPPRADDLPQRTGCWNVLVPAPDGWRVAEVDVVAERRGAPEA